MIYWEKRWGIALCYNNSGEVCDRKREQWYLQWTRGRSYGSLSLARVAAAHPPTARKSSRRYLCPEMPPHDTLSLHVCICREKFSESMFLSQLCVEVFLCLYWFILMLTYCRFGCNISQFIVRKKSYLELMKNLFCVAQYIFVKYHFYSL